MPLPDSTFRIDFPRDHRIREVPIVFENLTAARGCPENLVGAKHLPALSIEGLTRSGVAPVSLKVEAGEIVCLMGASGIGKSLLLRAIADLDPSHGQIRLDGRERNDYPACDWRRRVMLVPSESHWWAPRVGDHFAAIDDPLFQRLGFDRSAADWPVERLSSGERQRLALLRALACKPDVLLLDEPTANLDDASAHQVEEILFAYCRNTPAPVVWVTHSMAQASRVATRTVRLTANGLEQVHT